ncbi:MAG: citrate/2-methylcitrate synthase [Clostridiaceae bacterium]
MVTITDYKQLEKLSILCEKNNLINQEYYNKYHVKKGLRNNNGTGVLTGLTKIGNVHGYVLDEGEKVPEEGTLSYRGIDLNKIVYGFQAENRFGFEEVAYLLLFGELPSTIELDNFNKMLGDCRMLPNGFIEDTILKFPSNNIMNKLQRSVLVSYSFDKNPDDISVSNVLRQSIELISHFPALIAYGYQAKSHYYNGKSLYIHSPQSDLSTAENILFMIRPDNKFTKHEAEILDLSLVIHAEHGGGNNSAFSTHVVSSTGTDTYSAISAAVGSLKGPKHGGANIKVIDMMDNIKENIKDTTDEKELESYLIKILDKEAYDGSGLIYGIGHAIYTISDPRAVLLKEKAETLAIEKGRLEEFNLYKNIEKISSKLFEERKGIKISANVDFYSGFVYDMLNIPRELYTPIFATSRIVGWCAHRIEQLVSEPKIIRPAYKSVVKYKEYNDLKER